MEELNGDRALSRSERCRYFLSGLRGLRRGRGRARLWRVDPRDAAVRVLARNGASPLRIYSMSVLESIAREHVGASALVCDVGAGRAGNARSFPSTASYLAIDILPARGVTTGANRWYVQASALAIPVRSGAIDFVLTASSLEHVPLPGVVASELARVMRPGAIALHLVPAHSSLFLYGTHGYRRYGPADARELLTRDGAEVVDLFALGGPATFALHLVWIALFETGLALDVATLGSVRLRGLGPRMRHGRALSVYARLLRWAIALDARMPPIWAAGYAVVVRKRA